MINSDLINFSHKKILVTGGVNGIGLATAKTFISLGAEVIICDLNEQNCQDTASSIGAITGYACDISDEASVIDVFSKTIDRLGDLDVVVNCAGISEKIAGTKHQELSEWQKVIDVNLKGSFLVGREAAKHMKNGGSIIFLSSAAGIDAMVASNGYGVGKAGIIMMTKTMACDLARYNIRVNAVAPGYTDTPMAQSLFDTLPFDNSVFEKRAPMGRLATPEEIAKPIAFLASPMAAYITGIVLPVDGGWTAFGGLGNAAR
ncbi:MAG: SDR family oxidoreductase [Emcibacter sp.]|nr:SDR family oxidoreductase [Emcibacter sp.]